jgi:hypothetical protein
MQQNSFSTIKPLYLKPFLIKGKLQQAISLRQTELGTNQCRKKK